MVALLESHLEQITESANSIAELSFPPPRIFTNAMLNAPDITSLIRDTEAHERALFTVDPVTKSQRRATRRMTTYSADPSTAESLASRIAAARANPRQSAVARVLGVDMMEKIRRSTGTSARAPRGEIDVEVLLQGAEKLCNAYPIAGAAEKISSLRYRYQQVTESLARLEARVAENESALERMRRSEREDDLESPEPEPENLDVTDEDIQRELEEIRELERRKRMLEERVSGMERDLGGLMR
ncbi:hypothetical protein VTN31DRAFT_7477 [Thermomyces dupontii]|uniref:uncharacterized protein n=1 Tax=Talaromyces thermophilus TaxID=28565 RepID=UPI003743834A